MVLRQVIVKFIVIVVFVLINSGSVQSQSANPPVVCDGSPIYLYCGASPLCEDPNAYYEWTNTSGSWISHDKNPVIYPGSPGYGLGVLDFFLLINTPGGQMFSGSTIVIVSTYQLPEPTGPVTGPISVCQNASGTLYSVSPVVNATGYNWTVPAGWSIISGQNTTSINVTVGNTGGNVTVTANNSCGNSNTSTLAVTVNVVPAANAGGDQSISNGAFTTLNGSATGGSGNYTYHWEPASMLLNPNISNPTTIALTSSQLFTLSATDVTSGCSGSDQVLVTVIGGVLAVDVTASPNPSCVGNPVQLMAIAGGGTGNYTYLWTSNPPGFNSNLLNPVVNPVNTTTYIVVVNDGFSTTSDSAMVTVNPLAGTPDQPLGPDSVDVKNEPVSEYTTPSAPNAVSCQWELTPAAAGAITGSYMVGTVTWAPNYLGLAHIRVKAGNGCGESSWSAEKTTFVDNTTGTAVRVNPGFAISPNPTDGYFWLYTSPSYAAGAKVLILDMHGIILTETLLCASEKQFFSLKDNPPGIYFVRFVTGTEVKTLRVIRY